MRRISTGILFLLGCGGLSEGGGSLHDVVVVANSEDWALVGKSMRGALERVVRTPQEEKVFSVRVESPEEFGFFRRWHNILLVARLDTAERAADLARSLLDADVLEKVEDRGAVLGFRRDVWAKDQLFGVLVARDREALREKAGKLGDVLFRRFEEALEERLSKWIYREGEERKAEEMLRSRFGWSLRLPKGYRIERAEEGFVWVRKRVPERWVFVWWGDAPDSIDGRWLRAQRDSIGRMFYDGDRVVRDWLVEEVVEFAGRRAVKLSGLWENPKFASGGPFRCYGFKKDGKAYIVDVAVFAPGVPKEPYLRQVDIVARSLSFDR